MNSDTYPIDAAEPAPEALEEVRGGALTLRGLEAEFGIGRTSAFELIRSGALTGVKSGRRRLVTRRSVERYLARGLDRPATPEGETE